MWSFFSKRHSLESSGMLQGGTDYHCHLLPDADDGIQTIEESLKCLAVYEGLGIKSVWLTPHIMEDIPNTTEDLQNKFKELKEHYQGDIHLYLAAEYMLDSLFEERLEKNDLLPLGNDQKHLLVETSYFNPPIHLDETLSRIKTKGYIPVLAHPERYIYMDEQDYQRLKDAEIRFQINLPSLVGAYGKEVRKKVEWILKKEMADIWGTDTHRLAALSHLSTEKSLKHNISINFNKSI